MNGCGGTSANWVYRGLGESQDLWRAIFLPIGWGLGHPEAIGWAQSIVSDECLLSIRYLSVR